MSVFGPVAPVKRQDEVVHLDRLAGVHAVKQGRHRHELYGYDALQLPLERPLYGNEAPEPIGGEGAQMAMGRFLNNRAATIFGGSNEVQKNIIAKSVLGL